MSVNRWTLPATSAVPIPCAASFDTGEFIGVIAACGDATTMRTSYAMPVGPYAPSVLGFCIIGFGRTNLPTPIGTVLVNLISASVPVNGGATMGPGQYPVFFGIPNIPALNGAGPVNWQNVNVEVSTGLFSMSNGQEWWLAQ